MLYPVFLHTYLDLVDQGAAAAAAALMARHRRRFTEAGGRTSKLRMQARGFPGYGPYSFHRGGRPHVSAVHAGAGPSIPWAVLYVI